MFTAHIYVPLRQKYSTLLILGFITKHDGFCGSVRGTQPRYQYTLWEETGVPGENPRFSSER